jgi:hypothetical protein
MRLLCQRLVGEASSRTKAEADAASLTAGAAEAESLKTRLRREVFRHRRLQTAHRTQSAALEEAQAQASEVSRLRAIAAGQAGMLDRLQRLLMTVAQRAADKEEVWERRLSAMGAPPAAATQGKGIVAEASSEPGNSHGAEQPAVAAAAAPVGPPGTDETATDSSGAATGDSSAASAPSAGAATALLRAREMRIAALEEQLQDNAKSFAGQVAALKTRVMTLEAEVDSDSDE